jgi:hypothetical protein
LTIDSEVLSETTIRETVLQAIDAMGDKTFTASELADSAGLEAKQVAPLLATLSKQGEHVSRVQRGQYSRRLIDISDTGPSEEESVVTETPSRPKRRRASASPAAAKAVAQPRAKADTAPARLTAPEEVPALSSFLSQTLKISETDVMCALQFYAKFVSSN